MKPDFEKQEREKAIKLLEQRWLQNHRHKQKTNPADIPGEEKASRRKKRPALKSLK